MGKSPSRRTSRLACGRFRTIAAAAALATFAATSGGPPARAQTRNSIQIENAKAGDPGWQVGRVITVKGEDVVEPATPGQKYSEA